MRRADGAVVFAVVIVVARLIGTLAGLCLLATRVHIGSVQFVASLSRLRVVVVVVAAVGCTVLSAFRRRSASAKQCERRHFDCATLLFCPTTVGGCRRSLLISRGTAMRFARRRPERRREFDGRRFKLFAPRPTVVVVAVIVRPPAHLRQQRGRGRA